MAGRETPGDFEVPPFGTAFDAGVNDVVGESNLHLVTPSNIAGIDHAVPNPEWFQALPVQVQTLRDSTLAHPNVKRNHA